jgi:hypothetical protein
MPRHILNFSLYTFAVDYAKIGVDDRFKLTKICNENDEVSTLGE